MPSLSFKEYVFAFILVGLFLVAFTAFGKGIGENYDQSNFVDEEKVNLNQIESQLNTTAESASNWQTAFGSDNFFVSLGSIVLFSLWNLLQGMWIAINSFLTIYMGIAYNVFGLDPIVSGTLISLLIISIIFAIWRVIKVGD